MKVYCPSHACGTRVCPKCKQPRQEALFVMAQFLSQNASSTYCVDCIEHVCKICHILREGTWFTYRQCRGNDENQRSCKICLEDMTCTQCNAIFGWQRFSAATRKMRAEALHKDENAVVTAYCLACAKKLLAAEAFKKNCTPKDKTYYCGREGCSAVIPPSDLTAKARDNHNVLGRRVLCKTCHENGYTATAYRPIQCGRAGCTETIPPKNLSEDARNNYYNLQS